MFQFHCTPSVVRMSQLCDPVGLRMKQSTYEWLRYRSMRVTSTECYTAVFGTERQIQTRLRKKCEDYRKRVGVETGPLPAPTVPALRYGHEHEMDAAVMYARHAKTGVAEVGIAEHPFMRWLAASPDRVAPSHGCLVEIKCAYSKTLPRKNIPADHWVQMQIAMACTGIHKCDYVEYSGSFLTRDMHYMGEPETPCIFVRRVTFNRVWFEGIVHRVYSFYLSFAREVGIDIEPMTTLDELSPSAQVSQLYFHEEATGLPTPVQCYVLPDLHCYEALSPEPPRTSLKTGPTSPITVPETPERVPRTAEGDVILAPETPEPRLVTTNEALDQLIDDIMQMEGVEDLKLDTYDWLTEEI